MKVRPHIIALSLLAGALFWLADAVVDWLVFYGGSFWGALVADLPAHVVYARSVAAAMLVAFALAVSVFLTRGATARQRIVYLARFPSENPYPVLRVAGDGTLMHVNPAGEAVVAEWGCRVGRPVPDRWKQLAREVLRSGSIKREELAHKGRVFAFRIVPVAEAGYVNLYGVDITELKRAQESLRHSEHRYRRIVETAHEGIWIIDADSNTEFVNEGMAKMLGYDVAEMIATPLFEFMDEKWRGVAAGNVDLRRQGLKEVHDFTFRRKDGGEVHCLVATNALFDEDGQYEGALAMIVDVTDRKRAEQEIRAKTVLLEAQSEAAPDGILAVDEDGKSILLNRRFAEMWNMPPDVLETRDDEAMLEYVMAQLADPEEFLAKVRYLYAHKTRKSRDEIRFKDGKVFERYSAPLIDPKGRYHGRIWFFRDITDRKQLEEQFYQAQKMEAVGHLAGGVAHDFRNQLTVIRGYASALLRRSLVNDEGREKAAEIVNAADRSTRLTAQLLAFSRKEALEPQVIDLTELVQNLAKSLPRLIGEDIMLSVSRGPEPCRANVDPSLFDQTVVNLALNARDAMTGGGELIIETGVEEVGAEFAATRPYATPGRYAVLSVQDTGHGMDERTLERMYEPFFTTKERGHGTGLGLSMVYGFVKQSGGFIECESRLGRGTRFSLYFPWSPEPADEPAEADGPAPTTTRGYGTVLAVEDERHVLKMIAELLTEHGCRVLKAESGTEALALSESFQGPIDLLVTDVVIPGMTGTDLADRIRAARPGVRVLFVSGYTRDDLARHGAGTPRDNLLTKPFTREQLLAAVRRILKDRGRAGSPRAQHAGDHEQT